MYLINFKLLAKQQLPPHWRGTFKEYAINSFLAPLQTLHNSNLLYAKLLRIKLNLNAQTGVLQNHLNRLIGKEGFRFIELVDGSTGGELNLIIFNTYQAQQTMLVAEVKKYLPAGVKLVVTIS